MAQTILASVPRLAARKTVTCRSAALLQGGAKTSRPPQLLVDYTKRRATVLIGTVYSTLQPARHGMRVRHIFCLPAAMEIQADWCKAPALLIRLCTLITLCV